MARSAAYIVTIVAVVAGLIGTLVITVVDPVMKALFDSPMFSATTTYGTDALRWQQQVWNFWPAFILLGIMLMVWVRTRRARA